MKSIVFLAATLLCTADALRPSRIVHPRATNGKGVQEPSAIPQLGTVVSQGCFSSKGDLVRNGTVQFNSKGECADKYCQKVLKKPVSATSAGNLCFCGDSYPPEDTRVDDENCNIPCPGYDKEACGGIKYYSVYNTGLSLVVESSTDNEAKTSGTGTSDSAKPTQTAGDAPKETIIINNPPPEEKKTNTAGIAAGVVVAVVVVVAVAVGAWMYMKKKKNREIEEEHRRNAAVSSFMGKAPSSSSTSITDARLDPVMAQRRMSDGSIADNQDYSRRILRVTNA